MKPRDEGAKQTGCPVGRIDVRLLHAFARKRQRLRKVFAVRLHRLVGRISFEAQVSEELGQAGFERQV